jgi:antitoxin VapB
MPKLKKPSEFTPRRARLFRNGRNQAIRIPREFELPGEEVIVSREEDCLVIEPVRKKPGLLAVLRKLTPLDEEFPDVDEGLLPPDEVKW